MEHKNVRLVCGFSNSTSTIIIGGLINIETLTTKLNNLTDKVNALVDTFNGHTHLVNTTGSASTQSGTASAPSTQAQKAASFNKSDYEDQTIKH